MTQRILRAFISASYAEMREELEATKDAVMKSGCEPVSWDSHSGGLSPENAQRAIEPLRDSDFVVALFGNSASKFMLEELGLARSLKLPLLCFVKNSPEAMTALPTWIADVMYVTFENTTELHARIFESVARLRADLLRSAEKDPEQSSNADPPPAETEVKAAPGVPPPPEAPPPNATPGKKPESVLETLGDPNTLRIMRALGAIGVATDWVKRRAGALFVLGVMALVSYVWWSKSRIETPTAQAPTASNAEQAVQQSIPASLGPVDYRDPFNDLLREVPTTSGTKPGPKMSIVRSGTYSVGTDRSQLEALVGRVNFEDDEQPAHEVTIARPFAIGMHEIAVAEYTLFAFATARPLPLGAAAIVDENSPASTFVDGIPSDGRDNYPVQNVSWEDATAYANWLSSVSGARYRLPTEAEWELVARSHAPGGPTSYWGWNPQNDVGLRCGSINIDWKGEADYCVRWNGPIPVADEYLDTVANMLGNVAEWTADCYRPNYDGAPIDGSAVTGSNCAERVFRGGWWRSAVQFARPAFRAHAPPGFRDYSIGFRVVRDLSDEEIARLVDTPQQTQGAQPTPEENEARYPGVVVPDLMGMDEKAAIARLTEAGFDPRPTYKNVRDNSSAPVVVSQSPEAGARTEYGAVVDLILTPPPRAIRPAPTRQLPADTPSLRRPRAVPQQQEEPTSNDYEANPPQQQQQMQLPQESPPPQQQQQQQQLPATSGKDPDAADAGATPGNQP